MRLSKLVMGVFWVTGVLMWLLSMYFGLIFWDLPGLIAFAVIPPLELVLPFVVWFKLGFFPAVLFILWGVQIIAFLGMAATHKEGG
jgi:hypothetical protein